jgi:DNA-directed RNA polymerase subunit RPC12/RpoP
VTESVALPPGTRERAMATHKINLKVVKAPSIGHVLPAPPALKASDQSVDYTCGRCGTILLHPEEGQVHGLLIHCTNCGSYNSTDL